MLNKHYYLNFLYLLILQNKFNLSLYLVRILIFFYFMILQVLVNSQKVKFNFCPELFILAYLFPSFLLKYKLHPFFNLFCQ